MLIDIDGFAEKVAVFLNFSISDRSTVNGKTQSGPDWGQLQSTAKEAGFDIDVQGPDAALRVGEFMDSGKNDAMTVMVGHGLNPQPSLPWVTTALSFSDGQININGVFVQNPKGDVEQIASKVQANGIMALFTCNSESVLPSLFDKGPGGSLIVNTGGKDGLTRVGVLEKAAYQFVSTYVSSGGNIDAALKAAQNVFTDSAKGTKEVEPDPGQQGDTLERK